MCFSFFFSAPRTDSTIAIVQVVAETRDVRVDSVVYGSVCCARVLRTQHINIGRLRCPRNSVNDSRAELRRIVFVKVPERRRAMWWWPGISSDHCEV